MLLIAGLTSEERGKLSRLPRENKRLKLELCFAEPDNDRAEELLSADTTCITARHTAVEVRRNLAREIRAAELAAPRQFARDWRSTAGVS